MRADYHINVFFSAEDGVYVADIPDLKYCSAFGKTPERALREVLKAKEAWVRSAKSFETPEGGQGPVGQRRTSGRLARSGRVGEVLPACRLVGEQGFGRPLAEGHVARPGLAAYTHDLPLPAEPVHRDRA